MRNVVLAITVAVAAVSCNAVAQTESPRHGTDLAGPAAPVSSKPSAQTDDLVGTWRLVSTSATTPAGEKNTAPFGSNPKGVLIYTRDGRMSVIISYGGRKPLSGADRIASPADEKAAAFDTCLAYAGRYSFAGGKVTHHVEVSTVENWVNTDLVRLARLKGDQLTLVTPPLSVGGAMRTTELVWERIK